MHKTEHVIALCGEHQTKFGTSMSHISYSVPTLSIGLWPARFCWSHFSSSHTPGLAASQTSTADSVLGPVVLFRMQMVYLAMSDGTVDAHGVSRAPSRVLLMQVVRDAPDALVQLCSRGEGPVAAGKRCIDRL